MAWAPSPGKRKFQVSCMQGATCVNGNICCPNNSDCTDKIKQNPRCSNEEWDLYPEYFCCLSGEQGFANKDVPGIGCTDRIVSGTGNSVLVAVTTAPTTVTGSESTSSITPTATLSDSTPSETPDDMQGSSSSSSTNTGAIAGGVVGGVAGLTLILAILWFILRHRCQQRLSNPVQKPAVGPNTAMQAKIPAALYTKPELSAQADAILVELDGNRGAH
ncbi:uncharacterized protein BDV17DRAFT_252698 [Aspergillus undulatus]|uniref:uncharacterized protein n=1 Tax=Aspergillus undulatus TaxID=1810928 RepID=UPI003CCD5B22